MVPQVGALATVHAGVGLALLLPQATGHRVHLLDVPPALADVLLGDHHAVDSDVLDAARERLGLVGQDLLLADDAAQVRVEEDSVVLAGGVDGLRCLQIETSKLKLNKKLLSTQSSEKYTISLKVNYFLRL